MTDGFGSITWWGFSPALDLQDESISSSLASMKILDGNHDELNILLVGAGDPRHILKTIAHSHRYSHKRKLHFYVLENNLELYARDLLFLTIALESKCRMGLQEKTELFLELFGNALVRQQSIDYVEKMSTEFIKMVTDFDYMETKLPIIDMSPLKYKERDMLEGIFKMWRNPDKRAFDISKCWDLRLRQHLGVRYDAVPNVFDWDFSMKLVDKGAAIINSRKYGYWRHKGVAFEIREGTYDVSNKTLASGMVFKQSGENIARRGYWGDILVSPYIAYGIECDKEDFFKTANKQFIYTSQDVAEYNMLSILHEIATETKYVPPQPLGDKKEKQSTATLTEITEEEEEQENEDTEDGEQTGVLHNEYVALPLQGVKVTFLPLGSAGELYKKSKNQKLFNIVYMSNSMVHLLNEDLKKTFADEARIILETAKFMLELKEDQCQTFFKKICSIAKSVGCMVCEPVNEKEDNFVNFTFKQTCT